MSSHSRTIVVLPGDGVGPEVTRAAVQLLASVAEDSGHRFSFEELPIGGCAIDLSGKALPATTLAACRAADAVLLGAVGGPRWDALPLGQRPESGLLGLRKGLDLYINVRPTYLRKSLRNISPLRPSRARNIDLEIVRELAGGIYFGQRGHESANGSERAFDVESYTAREIERVAVYAFRRATVRRRHLVSVDKSNVLASSALWRKTVTALSASYPDVYVQHMYVDNAAMQLVLAPEQFDVIVTSNLFGDILSDAAAGLAGSIGLIPSMSCGGGPWLFEPIHGSAPSLAGRDAACPIGAILCASMMVREAFGMNAEAERMESAVDRVLGEGYRTADIAHPGDTVVGCSQFAALVSEALSHSSQELEPYGWGV